MTEEGALAAAATELAIAEECLAAARHECAGGFHRRSVASAYFAVFHGARAALGVLGLEPKSHVGLRQLFGQHLVRPGLFPKSDAQLLRHLQKDREDADYGVYTDYDDDDSRTAIEAADGFVERVRAFVASRTSPS